MQTEKTSMQNLIRTAFVCDINALNAEQRKRDPEVLEQLQMSVQVVQELPDGYAYRHVANVETLMLIGEFIALERPEFVSGMVVVSAVPGGFEMQGEPPKELIDW